MSDDTPETEASNESLVEVHEVALALRHVAMWHATKIKACEEMLGIPPGTEASFEEGKTIVLEKDTLLAYQIGLTTAMLEFAKLPFVLEYEEGPSEGEGVH